MLRRLGIRAKVFAVLAVPMLVVIFAGAFITWQSVQNLRTAQNVRAVVAAANSSVALDNALNDERALSLVGGTRDQVNAARAKTDAAVSDFVPKMTAIDLSPFSATAAGDVGQVKQDLTTLLAQARSEHDSGQTALVRSDYGSIVDDQIVLVVDLAQQVNNRQVASYITAYTDIARTIRDLVQEEIDGHALLVNSFANTTLGQAYTALANETEVYREAARSSVAGLGIGLSLPSGDPNAGFQRDRLLIGTGDSLQMSSVSDKSFQGEIAAQVTSLGQVSDSVFSNAGTLASQAITAAQQRAVITGAITIVAIVLSFVLAITIARGIVVPLRRLTAAATDLREELPRLVEQVQSPGEGPQMSAPQIPVTSRDEVGRLAGAFNAVNLTTFQVAQEQAALRGSIAEMFVNVARRDQVLLNRQLSFIDSLERTEEDPQALANLFRLDHLATRMRRNAESLLVLAGIDSGRRLRDALPLSDVVRTASSEIEQYDRVELDLQADPHMLGFNALPAAHLLAELLENATVFSEPETPVVVTTAVAGGFVEVRIADQGLGMSETELAAANEKIRSTSASDALGAQRLGLFVVGRLAQRLGAEVQLRKNPRGATGTETVVRFPATLFQSTEASPLGVYGETVAPAEVDIPELTEVDLAALTEGVTEQGLPRRRAALPPRPPARLAFDEDAIVLPDVTASVLPADLAGAGADWSPLVGPGSAPGAGGSELPSRPQTGADLPSRRPAAAGPVPPTAPTADAERGPAVLDPAARAGMFAGFRGRADLAATPPSPAPAEPEAPAFVVPGLAPDEEWVPGATAEAAWTLDAPVAAHAATEDALAWSIEPAVPQETFEDAPVWAAQHDGVAPEGAASAGALADPSSFVPAAPEPWGQPEAGVAEESAPQAASVPAAEPALDRWTPPEVDLAQWAVPAEEAPAFEPQPDAFAGLSGWNAPAEPAVEDSAAYAPFGHSLDEARAWATGALPVVPEPAGFPGFDATVAALVPDGDGVRETPAWPDWDADEWRVPQLEPDGTSDGAVAEVPAVVGDVPEPAVEPVAEVVAEADELAPQPVADLTAPAPEPVVEATSAPAAQVEDLPAPVELPVTPDWAPSAGAQSFAELVQGGDEGHARRRGWFGRRKGRAVPAAAPTPAAVLPPVPAPPAPAAALPVRSSAWAPDAATAVAEPFPQRAPAAAPTPPAPVPPVPAPAPPAATPAPAVASWAPQPTWTPPVAATLPDAPIGRPAAWSAPEWSAARGAQPARSEADPAPVGPAAPGPGASRIGTLDDEVAAMLALRSDIQEQALSELSQLSAYRPQVVQGSDRLARRVPTAVPQAPEIVESTAERDPNEVRSRLASFQSGTARGRRDAGRDEETS